MRPADLLPITDWKHFQISKALPTKESFSTAGTTPHWKRPACSTGPAHQNTLLGCFHTCLVSFGLNRTGVCSPPPWGQFIWAGANAAVAKSGPDNLPGRGGFSYAFKQKHLNISFSLPLCTSGSFVGILGRGSLGSTIQGTTGRRANGCFTNFDLIQTRAKGVKRNQNAWKLGTNIQHRESLLPPCGRAPETFHPCLVFMFPWRRCQVPVTIK